MRIKFFHKDVNTGMTFVTTSRCVICSSSQKMLIMTVNAQLQMQQKSCSTAMAINDTDSGHNDEVVAV